MAKKFTAGELWNATDGKTYLVTETFYDQSLIVTLVGKNGEKYSDPIPLDADGASKDWRTYQIDFALTSKVNGLVQDGIYVSETGRKFRIIRTDFYNNFFYGDRYPVIAFDQNTGETWVFDENGHCPEEGQLQEYREPLTHYVSVYKDVDDVWQSVVTLNEPSPDVEHYFSFED